MSNRRGTESTSVPGSGLPVELTRWPRLALCVLFAVGCSSISVTTDYDPSISFAEFQSYAFLIVPPQPAQDPRLHNSLVDGRVRTAVSRALQARDFHQAPLESADFLVAYHVGLETRIDVQTIHSTHRYGRRGGWYAGAPSHTTVREYEVGTLLLDILLPADKSLVWRGSATTRISQISDPEKRTQLINDAVEKILDRFPPE